MPHRVTSFFRSSNDNINNLKASVQHIITTNNSRSPATTAVAATTRTGTTSPASTTSHPRPGSTRTISYSSSEDGDAAAIDHTQTGFHSSFFVPPARMSEPAKESTKDKEAVHRHRISLGALHLGGRSKSKDAVQNPHASLDWNIESPPAVMYGDAETSSGVLVSGQLLLTVKESFQIDSFDVRLEINVVQKRPYHGHCRDCENQTTELKRWSVLAGPTTLERGVHAYPFSALLEGHLPASTDNSLVSIRYDLVAEVRPVTGPAIKLVKNINIKRSLQVPETPHHSVRVFPPTNITAAVHYPQVIHPIGCNKLDLRIDGAVKSNPDVNTVEYWKLKRVSWKIEEHLSTVAPACPKHLPKDPDSGEPTKKGLKRTETRIVGSGDMNSGWKSSYDKPDGTIELELEYQPNPASKPICDMKSRDGTEVTHQLVVEMVVAQEYAQTNQMTHVTPTGVARILRMHFSTVLTERAGLGVSWDNESPPIYQDVPPSPPSYCVIPYEEADGLSDLE